MILSCGQCGRQYDASTAAARTTVRCECGDLLVVPEPEQLESAAVIPEYIERWARDYGLTAETLQAGDGWEFVAGSVLVRVEHDAAEQTISIESVLFPLPGASDRRALCTRLLELNYRRTGEARFAIREGYVVATFSRPTLGLDYLEFQRAVEEVARTADDYDDELQAEFGELAADEE